MPVPDKSETPALEVAGLSKVYSVRSLLGRTTDVNRAVDNVSFTVRRGEVLGIVGESGSGKTTTARCVLRLVEPTAGRILLDGQDITRLSREALRPLRRKVQMVFQDPYSALDPRQTVADALGEPLDIHGVAGTRLERRRKVDAALETVGLDPALGSRRPAALSSGQRQRVCIARAIIIEPQVLVCDEPVASLDASIQAQVLNLISDLAQRLGIAVLFITHDLRVVRHICTSVGVMRQGRMVEYGSTDRVFSAPQDIYTRQLLLASPLPDPVAEMERRRQRQSMETAE